MTAFATYKEGEKAKLNPGLLWEYRLEGFDWQKYRKTVVERVIAMGRLSDWYAAFDLYGGIRGFRKIVRDEAVDISPRDLNFVCHALKIKMEDTRCYKQAQLRKARLGELPYADDCCSGATRPTTPSWPTRLSSTLATLTSC